MRKKLSQKINPYRRDLNKMLFKIALVDRATGLLVSGEIEFRTQAEFDSWLHDEYPGWCLHHFAREPRPIDRGCPILPMPSMVIGLPRSC